jgi:hypothetical protein
VVYKLRNKHTPLPWFVSELREIVDTHDVSPKEGYNLRNNSNKLTQLLWFVSELNLKQTMAVYCE